MKTLLLIFLSVFTALVSAQGLSDNDFGSDENIDFMYDMVIGESNVSGEVNRSGKGWEVKADNELDVSSFVHKKASKTLVGRDLKKIIKKSVKYLLKKNKKGVSHFEFTVEKHSPKWVVAIY